MCYRHKLGRVLRIAIYLLEFISACEWTGKAEEVVYIVAHILLEYTLGNHFLRLLKRAIQPCFSRNYLKENEGVKFNK